MREVTKVRIGIESARELEVEVEDGSAFADAVSAALENGSGLFWFTDAKGDRHGVVTRRVAFVEIEGQVNRRGVGFGAKGETDGETDDD